MSALGYSQVIIDDVCQLVKHYNLTMSEIYSCQQTYEFVPHIMD